MLEHWFGTIVATSFPPAESEVAVALTAWVVEVDARFLVTESRPARYVEELERAYLL